MPKFLITLADGTTQEVDAPEGVSQSEILRYVAAKQNIDIGASTETQDTSSQGESVGADYDLPALTALGDAPQLSQEQIDAINKEQMDQFSAIEKIKYEFDATESLTQNADLALDAVMPLGRLNLFSSKYPGAGIYVSPEEMYGEDFKSLNIDQRRERIQQVRYQEQAAEYPELTKLAESGQSTGGAGFLGAVIGALADPTTLLPIGQTYRAMAAIGGLLSGGYEALRGLVEEGEVDMASTAAYTAGGAVLTPALVRAGRAVAPALSKKLSPAANKLKAKLNQKRTAKKSAAAEETMEALNSKMMEVRAEGMVDDEGLLLAASKRLGLKADDVENAVINSNTKLDLPWNLEVDKVVLETKDALNSASAVKNELANKIIETTIRKVKQYSPVIANRLQKYEMDSSIKSQEMLQKIKPFQALFGKLSKDTQKEFTKRLKNRDWAGATKLAEDAGVTSITKTAGLPTGRTPKGSLVFDDGNQKYTITVKQVMESAKNTLDEMHMYANDAFGGVEYLMGHFPRGKIEREGLLQAFGNQQSLMYRSALKKEAQRLEKPIEDLTDKQKDDIFDSLFDRPKGGSATGGFDSGKQRMLETLDDDLLQFYPDNAPQALESYIKQTINNVEKYKFFKGVTGDAVEKKGFDVSRSVGSLVRKLQKEGEVVGDVDELIKIINLRFTEGEKSPHRFLQALRSFSSSLLLGNPAAAFIQFADQLTNIYRYGGDGGKAILQTILGKNVQNVNDFGLANYIATDLADVKGFTQSLQNTLFKYSGFRAVDRFGKNSLIQGAWNQSTRLVKSEKGLQQFKAKWGKTFGDEFESLVNDLKAGKVTENTKLLLWSELSGSQPISLSDMPQGYLAAPNGRIFYQLKSFTLKQIQLLQDSVIDEARKGNYKQAGKNALAYTVIVGGGQSAVQEARNAMKGRGFDVDRIPDHAINYMLSLMGSSKFGAEQLKDLRFKDVTVGMASPAILSVADFAEDTAKILDELMLEGYDWSELDKKNFKRFPGLGDMYYNFFGGGIEDFLEREDRNRD